MAGLTVTEKEHWKERIARRIDRRIAAIEAEEPNLMDRVKREARERALESLGLAPLQAELDEAKAHQKRLASAKRRSSGRCWPTCAAWTPTR